MTKIKTLTDYDSFANDFDQMRKPSPLLIEELKKSFEFGGKILSIGCGTGQYESLLSLTHNIIGLDKSMGMLKIAKERLSKCIMGNMIDLPFNNSEFNGVYFMQSFHHIGANFDISNDERISARKSVLKEALRVLKKGYLVIIQRDPSQNQAVWFWKYFPKALEKKLIIQPPIKNLINWLNEFELSNVMATPINDPMIKGFFDAEAPLNPQFRKSFSEFSYLSNNEMEEGVKLLKESIGDGSVWDEIDKCKKKFARIGGTVFFVSGVKK